MSLAWGSRLTSGSLSWGTRESSTTEGVINGSAVVSEFVENDLVLTWQLNGGVESDLTLLWQLDASPITAFEYDLTLTWNVIVSAGTSVEVDLVLLWQRDDPLVTVPDVANVAEHVARAIIQSVGELTTIVTNTSDNFVAKGDVISIYPIAGTRVLYNSTIEMTISLGWATSEDAGQGRTVYWQRQRKKLTLKQQPNKHLKKMLDDVGKKVLATHGKPKKSTKVKAIKLWQ